MFGFCVSAGWCWKRGRKNYYELLLLCFSQQKLHVCYKTIFQSLVFPLFLSFSVFLYTSIFTTLTTYLYLNKLFFWIFPGCSLFRPGMGSENKECKYGVCSFTSAWSLGCCIEYFQQTIGWARDLPLSALTWPAKPKNVLYNHFIQLLSMCIAFISVTSIYILAKKDQITINTEGFILKIWKSDSLTGISIFEKKYVSTFFMLATFYKIYVHTYYYFLFHLRLFKYRNGNVPFMTRATIKI